jgi:hypothetical protein
MRVAFWALVALVFLFALVFPGWMRHAIRTDREGATPQQGVATVAILVPPMKDATDQLSPPQVSVRFQGQILGAKEVVGLDELKVGQPAQITYRVGKSGRVYVDRVQPLPPSSRQR